jgi:hypothetical protein
MFLWERFKVREAVADLLAVLNHGHSLQYAHLGDPASIVDIENGPDSVPLARTASLHIPGPAVRGIRSGVPVRTGRSHPEHSIVGRCRRTRRF